MKQNSIRIIEDRAKFTMSVKELSVLRKILGARSVYRLVNEDGLSEREVKIFEEMYQALSDFFEDAA